VLSLGFLHMADEVECDGSKSWTISPTLTDATLEVAGCAAREPSIALLGGEPIATGPDISMRTAFDPCGRRRRPPWDRTWLPRW